MWSFKNPEIYPTILDFRDSGQKVVDVTQLWEDDLIIINAIEYVNWESPPFQFGVCEACGQVGCARDGWIDLRRSNSMAIIMPAFQKIESEKENKIEYFPPYFLYEKGVVHLSRDRYEHLQHLIPKLPIFEDLPKLEPWEASKIVQFEAPVEILGDILTTPLLPKDQILASSDGVLENQIDQFDSQLQALIYSDRDIIIRRIDEIENVITFYLDTPSYSEWNALYFKAGDCFIYLEPGYVLELQ